MEKQKKSRHFQSLLPETLALEGPLNVPHVKCNFISHLSHTFINFSRNPFSFESTHPRATITAPENT